ncbi:MAG: SinI family restriction endonuclease [Clostridiales bacterium]|jgi:hypothetical protein|nr:SinI family restriction endonuclease [Clostridiales bacterium]
MDLSSGVSVAMLKAYFDSKVKVVNDNADLIAIFGVAVKSAGLSLFPSIMGEGDYRAYIDKWILLYVRAKERSSLTHTASPKGSVSDPSVIRIVKTAKKLMDTEVAKLLVAHNLFMSAENAQGYLLEEYIASAIAAHGFLYCSGNLLRAVDFASRDGSLLLQIKNKSNTENSSSSYIRKNTDIRKWYRLGTKTKAGEKLPDYKWDKLNAVVTEYSGKPCTMSEEGYLAFIQNVVSQNPNIITEA